MNLFNRSNKTASAIHGFTLIEMLVVVAIIGILATLFIPSNLVKHQRAQVTTALKLTDNIRDEITNYYRLNRSFPADNEALGVPEADQLIGNMVTSIAIEDGAIHIVLGNKISNPLQGKILTIRPAVVSDSPNSPISWLCGSDNPVPGMEAVGTDKTDVADAVIPPKCGD